MDQGLVAHFERKLANLRRQNPHLNIQLREQWGRYRFVSSGHSEVFMESVTCFFCRTIVAMYTLPPRQKKAGKHRKWRLRGAQRKPPFINLMKGVCEKCGNEWHFNVGEGVLYSHPTSRGKKER